MTDVISLADAKERKQRADRDRAALTDAADILRALAHAPPKPATADPLLESWTPNHRTLSSDIASIAHILERPSVTLTRDAADLGRLLAEKLRAALKAYDRRDGARRRKAKERITHGVTEASNADLRWLEAEVHTIRRRLDGVQKRLPAAQFQYDKLNIDEETV